MFKILCSQSRISQGTSFLKQRSVFKNSTLAFSAASKRFPNEPRQPLVKTAFPGPQSAALIKQYNDVSCGMQQHFPVDMPSSNGNYVADADGNLFLDLFTSIACIGMGYNHPGMLEASKSETMRRCLATRTGLGINPPMEHEDLFERAFMAVAPKGMKRAVLAMCGACSVEATFKHAFIAHAQKKRGGMDVPPSAEELTSCLEN